MAVLPSRRRLIAPSIGRGIEEPAGTAFAASMADVISAFQQAMAAACIVAPPTIIADGNIHRFATSGRRQDDAGWYVIQPESPAYGAFGDFRNGIRVPWHHGGHACRLDLRQKAKIAEQAERRRIDALARHKHAAERARQLWASATPTMASHPYILRKNVRPFGARLLGTCLVLPIRDLDGTLFSLQFIGVDGQKRLLTGGAKRGLVIPVHGDLSMPREVLICEGWAIGATLAVEKPTALVLAAIDVGNLQLVTEKARGRWHEAVITVCADADPIGRMKARAATVAGAAFLVIPVFPPGVDGTDFNDLAALRAAGGEA